LRPPDFSGWDRDNAQYQAALQRLVQDLKAEGAKEAAQTLRAPSEAAQKSRCPAA